MRGDEELARLIGDIYDAALEPETWPAVLRGCAEFVGGSAAALFAKDAAHKTGNLFYQDGGLPTEKVDLYFETYVKLDPSTTALYLSTVGEPVSTNDLVPYDEFVQCRFFKEWGQPQNLVDVIGCVLDKTESSALSMCVFRHNRHGLVDDETRRRMRLIIPHVRRAVLIGRVIDFKTAEAATFADTLDGLAAGMLLVNDGGTLVHANASGHRLLAAGDLLQATDGRLVALDTRANAALADIFAAAGRGDAALGSKGIAVPLTASGGSRHVAHVLPLTDGLRRRAGASYAAVAAVFVHEAAPDTPAPPEAIAKAFDLTASELRVLLAIVQVGGVPETAEALGIAESTVRTHLKRLFAKTGTSRQAELVALMARFASPLAV